MDKYTREIEQITNYVQELGFRTKVDYFDSPLIRLINAYDPEKPDDEGFVFWLEADLHYSPHGFKGGSHAPTVTSLLQNKQTPSTPWEVGHSANVQRLMEYLGELGYGSWSVSVKRDTALVTTSRQLEGSYHGVLRLQF